MQVVTRGFLNAFMMPPRWWQIFDQGSGGYSSALPYAGYAGPYRQWTLSTLALTQSVSKWDSAKIFYLVIGIVDPQGRL